jgi:hypothetical protein
MEEKDGRGSLGEGNPEKTWGPLHLSQRSLDYFSSLYALYFFSCSVQSQAMGKNNRKAQRSFIAGAGSFPPSRGERPPWENSAGTCLLAASTRHHKRISILLSLVYLITVKSAHYYISRNPLDRCHHLSSSTHTPTSWWRRASTHEAIGGKKGACDHALHQLGSWEGSLIHLHLQMGTYRVLSRRIPPYSA